MQAFSSGVKGDAFIRRTACIPQYVKTSRLFLFSENNIHLSVGTAGCG
jgi:hypothetical protein